MFFLNIVLVTSVVNVIILLASLYHHNQYMSLNEYLDDTKIKKKIPSIFIVLLVLYFYNYIQRYNLIQAIIFIGMINYINYKLSLNIIRCRRLLKFNYVEYLEHDI